MGFKITVTKPVYLDGLHYNIPLKETWNESLLAGLNDIAKEIKDANLTADVHNIEIERSDDFADFQAQGDIGYSTPAKSNEQTAYYYVDFSLADADQGSEYENWYRDNKYFRELNNKLNDYLDKVHNYQLVRSKYGTEIDDEGEVVLRLRAYFVQRTKLEIVHS